MSTEIKVPLRKPFELLDQAPVADHSTLYRRIFKSLGLGTVPALFSFWSAIQSNMCRRNKEFVPPEDLPQFGPAIAPAGPRGFDVEMIEEDPDCEIDVRSLRCGVLILGDDQIAAYDTDGTNVFIAVREDSCIVVYNIRDLIAVYLCDELRLQFAQAVAVPVGAKTTLQAAQAGTQSALASLLGLGYFLTPGTVAGESYITITSRGGATASLSVQHMAGFLGLLMEQDPSRLADPEWVFAQIHKQASVNNNASKPE